MRRTESVSWSRLAWHLLKGAAPALTVATLVPLALFYVVLALGDETAAVIASLVYAYAAIAFQYWSERRVSGMLMVTVAMASVKALTIAVSGRPFLYFAFPAVETVGFGMMFLVTLGRRQPLLLRLARDLVPSAVEALAASRPLVTRLSLVWGAAYLGSGLTTCVMLVTLPIPVFVGAHTLAGWCWTSTAAVLSVLFGRRRLGPLLTSILPARAPKPVPVPVAAPMPAWS